jgi:hypothetical protein
MPLANDPQLNLGVSGNALPLTLLNHTPNSPSSVTFTLNFNNIVGGFCQIWSLPSGSVGTTNGTLIQGFSSPDAVWYDTLPFGGVNFIMATVAGANPQRQTITYDIGQYGITLTNQDTANAIYVMATTGLIT